MVASQIHIPTNEIEAFCEKWEVKTLELFGSALREDFSKASDIDIMVSFQDAASPSLFDIIDMKEELEAIFRRPVDILSRKAVEKSKNPYRKEEILSSAKVIYAKAA